MFTGFAGCSSSSTRSILIICPTHFAGSMQTLGELGCTLARVCSYPPSVDLMPCGRLLNLVWQHQLEVQELRSWKNTPENDDAHKA